MGTDAPSTAPTRDDGGGDFHRPPVILDVDPLVVQALLGEVARQIGDVQVRNKGTFGGSLVHADPAADWPA